MPISGSTIQARPPLLSIAPDCKLLLPIFLESQFSSLSVMVENVADCPCILLGPCRGTVHLRNLRNCSITVACGRLLVEEVENCVIFVAARLSPVILSSESVQFAPFNCCYTVIWVLSGKIQKIWGFLGGTETSKGRTARPLLARERGR